MNQLETGATIDALFRKAYAPMIKRIVDHGLWDFPTLGMVELYIQDMPRKPKRWRSILRDMERCPKIGDETKFARAKRIFGVPAMLEDDE